MEVEEERSEPLLVGRLRVLGAGGDDGVAAGGQAGLGGGNRRVGATVVVKSRLGLAW